MDFEKKGKISEKSEINFLRKLLEQIKLNEEGRFKKLIDRINNQKTRDLVKRGGKATGAVTAGAMLLFFSMGSNDTWAGGSIPGGGSEMDKILRNKPQSSIKIGSLENRQLGSSVKFKENTRLKQQKNNFKKSSSDMSVNGSSEVIFDDGNLRVIGDKNTKFEKDSRGNISLQNGILINED